MKPTLILGVGPAGLMAAHACKLAGVPFSLVSQGIDLPAKSVIGGAQFLHVSVPLLADEPEGQLTYHLVGDAAAYKDKVYGPTHDIPFVSAQFIQDGKVVDVWSTQRAYDRLWDDIAGGGHSVNIQTVGPEWLIGELEADRWAHIISTIPRHQLCLTHAGLTEGRAHRFSSQRIEIMNQCMFAGAWDFFTGQEMNHIWYNGTDNVSWYRTSMIFGVGSTEWGESVISLEKKLPYKTVTVLKPISNDCTCFNGKVMFTGRFGAWKKGLLIHHAFVDTWKLLNP